MDNERIEQSLRIVFQAFSVWGGRSQQPKIYFLNGRIHNSEGSYWAGPESIDELRDRVSFVASSLGIIGKEQLPTINRLAVKWAKELVEKGEITRERMRAIVQQESDSPGKSKMSDRTRLVFKALGLNPERRATSIARADVDQQANQSWLGEAIHTWEHEFSSDERWTTLPSSMPGEVGVSIDEAYVELYAIDADLVVSQIGDGDVATARTQRQRMLPDCFPLIDADNLLARTKERAVVVGEPGAGKSTFVKWVTQRVFSGDLRDFTLPIVVSLAAYAKWLSENSIDADPLEYFLIQHKVPQTRASDCADLLRQRNRSMGIVLLLFDGWDEIPYNRREEIKANLVKASSGFTTVITSRPSGLPRELATRGSTDFYELAGLSLSSIERLAKSTLIRLGREDELPQFLVDVETRPDLALMAMNPFLLTLICTVRTQLTFGHSATSSTFDLYNASVKWITDQYNDSREGRPRFEFRHQKALRDLAYDMLFTAPDPRYSFRLNQLETAEQDDATSDAIAPILGTRMVNCLNPVVDDYAFIHATFEEFFAAEAMEQLDEPTFRQLAGMIVLVDSQRAEVVRFLAGMNRKNAAAYWDVFATALHAQDRYGLVNLRAASVIAALGSVKISRQHIGVDIRDRLWAVLRDTTLDGTNREDQIYIEATVIEYVALDARDLVERAAANPDGLHSWTIQCIVQFVPWRVAECSGLHELMDQHEEWQYFRGMENRRGVDSASIAKFRNTLEEFAEHSDEQQQQAAVRLGAMRDRESIDILIDTLKRTDSYSVANQVIAALARIGGEDAANVLCDTLIGELQFSESMEDSLSLRFTAPINGLRVESQGAITPEVRERLLRVIATSPIDSAESELSLEALVGLPIRDGSEILFSLLDAPSEVTRERVARLLSHGYSPNTSQALSTRIMREDSPVILDALLTALAHHLPNEVPKWLEMLILDSNQDVVVRRAAVRLMAQFLREDRNVTSLERARSLLDRLVLQSLRDTGDPLTDVVFEQADVFSDKHAKSLIKELGVCIAEMESGDGNAALTASRIARALATMDVFDAITPLTELLRSIHRSSSYDLDGPDKAFRLGEQALSLMAEAVAEALIELDPIRLLDFPAGYRPVEKTLKSWSLRTQHLVYDDRIMDTKGRRVKQRSQSTFGKTIDDLSGMYKSNHRDILAAALERLNIIDPGRVVPPPYRVATGVAGVSTVYFLYIPSGDSGLNLVAKFDDPERADREWSAVELFRRHNMPIEAILPISGNERRDGVIIYHAADGQTLYKRCTEIGEFLERQALSNTQNCILAFKKTLALLEFFYSQDPGAARVADGEGILIWAQQIPSLSAQGTNDAIETAKTVRVELEQAGISADVLSRIDEAIDALPKTVKSTVGRTMLSRVHGDLNLSNVLVLEDDEHCPDSVRMIDLSHVATFRATATDLALMEAEVLERLVEKAEGEIGPEEYQLLTRVMRRMNGSEGRFEGEKGSLEHSATWILFELRKEFRRILQPAGIGYNLDDYLAALYLTGMRRLLFKSVREQRSKAGTSLIVASLAYETLQKLRSGSYARGATNHLKFPERRSDVLA